MSLYNKFVTKPHCKLFFPEIYGRILINSFNIMNAENLPIGIGLYLEGSVFDHSCDPNATVVFDGKRIIVRTIRSVLNFPSRFCKCRQRLYVNPLYGKFNVK